MRHGNGMRGQIGADSKRGVTAIPERGMEQVAESFAGGEGGHPVVAVESEQVTRILHPTDVRRMA